jgi:hypothetical protein
MGHVGLEPPQEVATQQPEHEVAQPVGTGAR